MRSGPHDVKPLQAVLPDYQGGEHYCDKHKERVKMYCFHCQINVCSMCCLESHKTHKFERIDVVTHEFARSIDEEIERATSHIKSFNSVTAQTEAENSKLLSSIQATEREIKNKGEDVKRSFERRIDGQVGELLDKLQSMKSAAEKEVQSRTDAVQLALTELESFRTSSLELKSKGSPSDIVQAAGDVRVRASELLQKHVIPAEYLAPSYTFIPADTDQLLTDDRNFIGRVIQVENPDVTPRRAPHVLPGTLSQMICICFSALFISVFYCVRMFAVPSLVQHRPGVRPCLSALSGITHQWKQP